MFVRKTPAASFVRSGTGVHSGRPATVVVRPERFGAGIAFVVDGIRIPARLEHARGEAGSTCLESGAARVRTVEHLMAALAGHGITDAVIEVSGPEVPILDGSARGWSEAFAASGVVHGPAVAPIAVEARWTGRFGMSEFDFYPSESARVAVDVVFDAAPQASGEFEFGMDDFDAELASARTFVVDADIPALRAAGRGLGADPSNTVIFGANSVSVPLRFADEAARHKCLDWLGDLWLLGAPLCGRFVARRGTHAAHVAALRAWAAGRSATC